MTYRVSVTNGSTHISTAVKWYDPARNYGLLVPDDGSPDIYRRAPALAPVGLETLLARACHYLSESFLGFPRRGEP